MAGGCTTLDHVYPDTQDGTPCYCGRRRWNMDAGSYTGPAAKPTRTRVYPPRRGALVELRGHPGVKWAVAEVDREAGMFRVSAAGDVNRGGWLDKNDLA